MFLNILLSKFLNNNLIYNISYCFLLARSSKNSTRSSRRYVFDDTALKMKFAMKEFFSKCYQIRRKLRIWSHGLKKSLMENFMFCAV